jgi:hypothetical protein
MLLELLNHHSRLFLAAIEPLILRRDCRSLGALAVTCRQIRSFLADEVPMLNHHRMLGQNLMQIKNINILYNNYVSIREYRSTHVVIYSYWNDERDGYGLLYPTNTTYWIFRSDTRREIFIVYKRKKVKIHYYNCFSGINIYINGTIPTWLYKYNIIDIHQNANDASYGYVFDTTNL